MEKYTKILCLLFGMCGLTVFGAMEPRKVPLKLQPVVEVESGRRFVSVVYSPENNEFVVITNTISGGKMGARFVRGDAAKLTPEDEFRNQPLDVKGCVLLTNGNVWAFATRSAEGTDQTGSFICVELIDRPPYQPARFSWNSFVFRGKLLDIKEIFEASSGDIECTVVTLQKNALVEGRISINLSTLAVEARLLKGRKLGELVNVDYVAPHAPYL